MFWVQLLISGQSYETGQQDERLLQTLLINNTAQIIIRVDEFIFCENKEQVLYLN